MALFRKKPIVVEAVRYEHTVQGLKDLREFCGEFLLSVYKNRHPGALGEVEIATLEDGMHLKVNHIATEGDWIVKGVNGEFWPVKPDIFEKTYEPVGEAKKVTGKITIIGDCV